MSATVGDDLGTMSSCSSEDFFRAKRPVISLGPNMGTGTCVDQLHRDAQPGPRLAKTPFHHIACAKFLADGPDVDGLVGVSQRGTARDDSR